MYFKKRLENWFKTIIKLDYNQTKRGSKPGINLRLTWTKLQLKLGQNWTKTGLEKGIIKKIKIGIDVPRKAQVLLKLY